MEKKLMAEDVRNEILALFNGSGQVDLQRKSRSDRVTGWIVHEDFTGVAQADRQKWLWDGFNQSGILKVWSGLKNIFGERSTQIGLILTYSPSEYDNAFDESA